MSPESKGVRGSWTVSRSSFGNCVFFFFYHPELMDGLGLIQSQSKSVGMWLGLDSYGIGQETGKASTREAGTLCASDPLPTETREQEAQGQPRSGIVL